jgi:cytochrome c oxidase subunit 4
MATHATDAHDAPHSHAKTYLVIWIVLLLGTVLTVVTAKADLGGAALPVALIIASTKALLVLLYFMHLNEATGPIRIVAATSFLFIALMLSFQLGDFATRFPGLNSEGSAHSALPKPPPRHMQGVEPVNPQLGTTP